MPTVPHHTKRRPRRTVFMLAAAALTMLPIACGMKLTLRLQLAPGASKKLLVQSAGVPEPAPCWKEPEPMLKPGGTETSG